MDNHPMPVLILIRGLPGSGKSHLAETLRSAIGQDKAIIIDPDKTDHSSKEYLALSQSLTAEGVDEKFHPYRFLRAQAYAGITSGKVIIWNQAFTNLDGFNKTVINLQAYATDHGTELPVLVVEVAVSHDVAKQRVAKRVEQGGHDVKEEAWARFIHEYTTFSDQGYEVIAVNGEDDVLVSVAAVTDALDQLRQ